MRRWNLAIVVLLAFNVCSDATAQTKAHHEPASMSRPGSSRFETEMDDSMVRMMEDMHSPGYSGDADRDFLVMMVPHHQGAVDMAKLVLMYGRDPAVRVLAEEIIAGQTIEIESMRRRLAALRTGMPLSDYPTLGGARGP